MTPAPASAAPDPLHALAERSEMAARVLAHDWAATPLGPRDAWPGPLKAAVYDLLASGFPSALVWGPARVTLYNDGFRPILGDKPEALGRSFADVWEEAWAEIGPIAERALAGQSTYIQDFSLLIDRYGEPEQAYFTFSYSPVHGPDGTVLGLLDTVIETTAGMKAQLALRALNEDLERQVVARSRERGLFWRYSLDLLSVIDLESATFDSVNPAWGATLGWSPDEISGRPYAEFVHPDDLDTSATAFRQVRQGDPVLRFENRYRDREGVWHWLSWVAVPEGGKLYSVTRDITRERERAEALALAQEALRQSQKLESMGQLTGGVAHDVNNLLTPITGALDLLQRRGLGGDRERRLIDGALQSAERIKLLVQRLLAFARRQPLHAAAVDVGRIIGGMADLIGSTTGPQIRIVLDVAGALPAALADANQLEMALLNLSVNARDAMADGGTLRISAQAEQVAERHRTALPAGRYIRVSVADTGTGMDAATLSRAIEPFFSTKGIGKGTGLGLSMVHGLAAQLGGALHIASTPGVGTNVELWLPATEEAAAEPEAAAEVAPAAAAAAGTALLVDDQPLVRAATAAMLGELGYAVIEAGSAEQALGLLGDGLVPDLLVSDHLMPGMNGTDLVRAARERLPDLPALIVSGYAEVEGIAPDLPRLSKPFRQGDLAARLLDLGALDG